MKLMHTILAGFDWAVLAVLACTGCSCIEMVQTLLTGSLLLFVWHVTRRVTVHSTGPNTWLHPEAGSEPGGSKRAGILLLPRSLGPLQAQCLSNDAEFLVSLQKGGGLWGTERLQDLLAKRGLGQRGLGLGSCHPGDQRAVSHSGTKARQRSGRAPGRSGGAGICLQRWRARYNTCRRFSRWWQNMDYCQPASYRHESVQA